MFFGSVRSSGCYNVCLSVCLAQIGLLSEPKAVKKHFLKVFSSSSEWLLLWLSPGILILSRRLFWTNSEIEFFFGPVWYLSADNNGLGRFFIIWETPSFLSTPLSSLSGGTEFLLFVLIIFDFVLTLFSFLTGSLPFLFSDEFPGMRPDTRLDPLLKVFLDFLPVFSLSLVLKIGEETLFLFLGINVLTLF